MKIPAPRRQRVHLKSFHRQWRRTAASIDFYFARISQRERHAILAELAAREQVMHDVWLPMSVTDFTTDNGDGSYSQTLIFTPKIPPK